MSDIDIEKQEKNIYSVTTNHSISTPESNSGAPVSKWQNFKDSFKEVKAAELDPNLTEAERVAIATANAPLKRHLKSRHIQMIAIGGAIGTGLFVGSGSSLRTAGPAGVLIGYGISSTFILCMICALGEMAVEFPVSGGFTTYATRFVDDSFGFAANFNYALQWLVILPLEIVSASITVNYWDTPKKYRDGFVALFWIVIVSINMFGVKGFGEAEFFFSTCKVLLIIGFIICGICLVCGVRGPYIGGTYWHAPYGAFVGDTAGARFKGVMSVFTSAAFAFGGSEMVGLAAAETANPRKTLPKAAKQVFWRITIFYMVSLTLVGLLVSHKDPRLIGSSSADAAASPFVIALVSHGIKGLPSVFNVVICIAVLSVGNSSVYACSRTLAAFSEQGYAPKWMRLEYVDRAGRPLVGIVITSVFGLLGFVAASDKEGEVFNWLYAIFGLSSLFTWAGICLCHIRFRRALSAQGRTTNELSFVSPVGVIGSFYGFFVIMCVLIAEFWVAAWPSGYKEMTSKAIAVNFFEIYLSFPVFLVTYFGRRIYKKNWKICIPPAEVDIDTGRRDIDLEELKLEIAEEKAVLAAKPFYKRAYAFWCQ
ncbi:amino acid permease [Hanseniaspora valbyensis NRRL Y-1626]|uniref:Amino acid permease n=1 Tax=Hanseniaspora valbyensis NRRL Y-1626 TaxID=766949 RepID=A0A1B7TI75_9ASCO|nr:amino acid permease [Hanseniaspora valbyensis NRRL Y-1626]